MMKQTDKHVPSTIWQPPGSEIFKPFNPQAAKDAAAHAMMDINADGKLSKDEWSRTGRSAEMFAAYDKNGDGKVCEKEYVNGRRAEREFAAKDHDGDGSLNFREWSGMAWRKGCLALGGMSDKMLRCMNPFDFGWRRFNSQDTNNDGKLSAAEYVAANSPAKPTIQPRPWLMKATG